MIVINNSAGAGSPATSDMPIGAIVLWYGTSTTVPAGYAICDGAGGLPDFRGKLICGASNDAQLLTTGGAATHLHAGATSDSAGSHDHNFSFSLLASTWNYGNASIEQSYAGLDHLHGTTSGATSSEGSHTHASTGSSGLSSSLPYCKLLYWIKRIA